MKALQYTKKTGILLRDVPKPKPQPDEVLVGLSIVGLCNTDKEISLGYSGYEGTLGHEFVGVIVDDPLGELTGKRVVGEINIPCGSCPACYNLQPNHCHNIKVIGIRNYPGVFSEYFTIPRDNIHIVPDSVSDIQAVFVEPLAAALEIPDKNHLRQTEQIAILGDGKLGLLTAAALHALNFDVHIIGKHQAKLDHLNHLNICTHLLADELPLMDTIIECTGSQSGLETALKLIKPEGRIIIKTTIAGEIPFAMSKVAVAELNLVGSRCGPFSAALRLLANNDPGVASLVTATYPLSQGEEAFRALNKKEEIKIVLTGNYFSGPHHLP